MSAFSASYSQQPFRRHYQQQRAQKGQSFSSHSENDTAERLHNWEKMRRSKTERLKQSVQKEKMQSCTFTPTKFSRNTEKLLQKKPCKTPTEKNATNRHTERLLRARKQQEAKQTVPHATGKRWTGKTTTPVAPKLSYQTKAKKSSTQKAAIRHNSYASLAKAAKSKSSCHVPVNKERAVQPFYSDGVPPYAPDESDIDRDYGGNSEHGESIDLYHEDHQISSYQQHFIAQKRMDDSAEARTVDEEMYEPRGGIFDEVRAYNNTILSQQNAAAPMPVIPVKKRQPQRGGSTEDFCNAPPQSLSQNMYAEVFERNDNVHRQFGAKQESKEEAIEPPVTASLPPPATYLPPPPVDKVVGFGTNLAPSMPLSESKTVRTTENIDWDVMQRKTKFFSLREKDKADKLQDRLEEMERENMKILGIGPDQPPPKREEKKRTKSERKSLSNHYRRMSNVAIAKGKGKSKLGSNMGKSKRFL
jgi:hypothetical protein